MKMKKLLSLILTLCLSFANLAQSSVSGGSSVSSSRYNECQEGIASAYEDGKKTCFKYRCSGEAVCLDSGEVNLQNNNVTINKTDNRKTDYNTTRHETVNNIIGGDKDVSPALNTCQSTCFKRNGSYKGGEKCIECINIYADTEGRVDFDFTTEVEVQVNCKKCSAKNWKPSCGTCPEFAGKDSEGKVCEHSDKECTEKEKSSVNSTITLGNDCVDCEIARINADRDIAIAQSNSKAAAQVAKENRKAARQGQGGFWSALGTLGTAAAGVLAPLLVEKERTKQISSCHNSYSNGGADVIQENRLAFESELSYQHANSLPLSTWEQMNAGENYAFMCNGGGAGGFAGGFGQGGGFGIGGFNPYGGGGYGYGGYGQGGGFNGFGGQAYDPFGSILGSLGGMIPNISFGANAYAGVGGTAWSQGAQPYYGTNPYSPYPNTGGNNIFDQGGYGYGGGQYGTGGYGSTGGYNQGGGTGGFAF